MRIIIISTYPIQRPRHGGQKRVEAMLKAYTDAGHVVRHIGIYEDTSYADKAPGDLVVSLKRYNNPLTALVGDLLMANVLEDDLIVRNKFLDIIHEFRPDVVQIEQIFLYKAIWDILQQEKVDVRMINSTHNVESTLKQKILESSTNLSAREIKEVTDNIRHIENFAARHSDWTLACTDSDAREFEQLGAPEVIVVPNGIKKGAVDTKELQRIRAKLASDGIKRIILYVGSAHPPNLTGYRELIGGGVCGLQDDERLVIVGGVADMVLNYAEQLPNYIKTLYFDKVVLMGMVEEKTLTALLAITDEIILPILEGSGSNLKTAEAILADKRVVATTKSLHSYEKYLKLPNVIVADTRSDFIKAMVNSLHKQKKLRSKEELQLAQGVLWENVLKAMVDRLEVI